MLYFVEEGLLKVVLIKMKVSDHCSYLGSVGSHRYKRLFGELHLEGFDVSHTKDGFQWDDNMDAFLELLKEELQSENSIPILKQADKYRVKEDKKKL